MLTPIRFVEYRTDPSGFRRKIYEFECSCGTLFETCIYRVRSGTTKSCGCLKRNRITKHGLHKSPEYHAWEHMHQRCRPEHPNSRSYHDKGIAVAAEWTGDGGFQRFLEHIGPRPTEKHTVDRIDNAKGYVPGNVRWATRAEQAVNRGTTRFVLVDGKAMPLKEAMKRLGLHYRKAVKVLQFVERT